MTTEKTMDDTAPGKESKNYDLDRVPVAVLKLIDSTPKKERSKIRAFLIGTEEEAELVEMLPEVNRVMTVCPPKLVGRVRKHEITGDQFEQGYQQLHDAIHGVRQALYAVLILAGFEDPENKELKPKGSVPVGPAPTKDLAPGASADSADPGRFAHAGGSRKF